MSTRVEKVLIKEFKNLHDLEAFTGGDIVLFKGDNGQGKSTMIQFIEIALGRNNHIPPNAFGKGEVVITHAGHEYIIKVEIKEGRSILKITGSDGLKDNTKGAVSNLLGANKFDPEEFVNNSKTKAGRKEQIEKVKSFFPEEAQKDLQKYEKDIAANFEERTNLNRDLSRIKGTLETNPLYKELVWKAGEPLLVEMVGGKAVYHKLDEFQKINTSEVFKQLQAAQTKNAQIEDVLKRKADRTKEIADLEAKLKDLRDKNAQADEWLAKPENQPVNTDPMEEQLNDANAINQKAENVEMMKNHIKQMAVLEESVGDLTAAIEMGREMIQNAIKDNAAIIMDGLSFDEDQLLYNGIPVHPDSMSTSEIMELSMRLRHRENPNAPICMHQTECLGEERWNTIKAFAKEHDLQILGEQVIRGQEQLTIEIVAE